MRTYTAKEILDTDDLYELQDSFCSSGIPFKYQITKDELGWLRFIKNRYSIADWLYSKKWIELDDSIVIIFDDYYTMSKALDEDCEGIGKAVCLSDDTALQKLFFWLYTEV